MKKLIQISTIAALTLVSSVSLASKPSAHQIYAQTAKEIRTLHSELRIGEVVAEVESTLKSQIRETVTEVGGSSSTHTRADAYEKEFEGYRSRWDRYPTYSFGSYSFHNSSSSSVDWDVTEFIHQNPEETSRFRSRVRENHTKLRGKLLAYVNKNERKLVRFKELGVRNLAAAYEMLKTGQKVRASEITETVAILGDLSFLGRHEVTTCVTVEYADRSYRAQTDWETQWARESAEDSRWATQSVSDADSRSGQRTSYWRQLPHSNSRCKSSMNQIEVGTNAAVFEINLSQLDEMIEGWVKSIDVLRMKNPDTPLFPTFGSPYYK